MNIFGILAGVFILLRVAGLLGVAVLDNSIVCLRYALAALFMVTASAHWGKRRAELVAMVPPALPSAPVMVTIIGLLELAGAVGLAYEPTSRLTALGLVGMLVAIFPANVYAVHQKLTINGKPVTPLPLRMALQVVYVGCLMVVALHA